MFYREVRDSLLLFESYLQYSLSFGIDFQCNERMLKFFGYNFVLNKFSCVIIFFGLFYEEEDGSYIVVMRDYGIQIGLLIEQGIWIVKVEFVVLRVYIIEKEVLVYFYSESFLEEEDEFEEEEEGDYNEFDDVDEIYSLI